MKFTSTIAEVFGFIGNCTDFLNTLWTLVSKTGLRRHPVSSLLVSKLDLLIVYAEQQQFDRYLMQRLAEVEGTPMKVFTSSEIYGHLSDYIHFLEGHSPLPIQTSSSLMAPGQSTPLDFVTSGQTSSSLKAPGQSTPLDFVTSGQTSSSLDAAGQQGWGFQGWFRSNRGQNEGDIELVEAPLSAKSDEPTKSSSKDSKFILKFKLSA